MTTSGPSTAPAGSGGPRPVHAAAAAQQEAVRERRDLTSWWRTFKGRDKKSTEQVTPAQGIFGVPLPVSIRYANVAISHLNDEGQSYIYGYVPIVVAKCGVFLKEKATDVEGIFRLAGSEKRIKELKVAFDSPDKYGKGLDWTGYTVHDAANILRRYFNQLPEPIIPLDFYERFRDPLKNHQQQAVGTIDAVQAPSEGEFDPEASIKIYQRLITELPPLNRQLLLYILDLLAVFASKSDQNKMTTSNLAAIFQPGILNHPQHDMAPKEYRLSQDVLIFLIENQDSFLLGMEGTAADAETVREVQSGSPAKPSTPTTPSRSQTVIARSGSNSTAGSESVRKWGSIRRNVSVSSKHSKKSEAGPTVAVAAAAPLTPTNGVHRSNTVPSRRAGNVTQSPRIPREKTSDPSTPTATTPTAPAPSLTTAAQAALTTTSAAPAVVTSTPPTSAPVSAPEPAIAPTPAPASVDAMHATATPAPAAVQRVLVPDARTAAPAPVPPEAISASSSEVTTPMATAISSDTMAREFQTPKKDTIPLLAPPGSAQEKSAERSTSIAVSTNSGRNFLGILKQSPGSDGEGRKPNKLQKRRVPGSSLSSAHSSSHSLDEGVQRSPTSPVAGPSLAAALEVSSMRPADATAQGTAPEAPQKDIVDATAPPTSSPPRSFHSQTDTSDADLVGDDMPTPHADYPEKTRRRSRWRLSRTVNKTEQPPMPHYALGTAAGEHAVSRSTIGSSAASQPRRSLQDVAAPLTATITEQSTGHPPSSLSQPVQSPSNDAVVFSDSERERSKGPMSWIRGKLQDRRDKDAVEKRSRTPERSHHERSRSKQDLSQPFSPGSGLPPSQAAGSAAVESAPLEAKSTEQHKMPAVDATVASPSTQQVVSADANGNGGGTAPKPGDG